MATQRRKRGVLYNQVEGVGRKGNVKANPLNEGEPWLILEKIMSELHFSQSAGPEARLVLLKRRESQEGRRAKNHINFLREKTEKTGRRSQKRRAEVQGTQILAGLRKSRRP